LEKIYGKWSPKLTDAYIRALAPFNTQPSMSGPVLGVMIKTELDVASGRMPQERADRFKSALTSAFAAIGDAFFWNALLPAAAAAGMFWALEGQSAGAWVFIIVYNLIHLPMRILGFFAGCRWGLETAVLLDRLHLPKQTFRLRIVLAGLLGGLGAWVWSLNAPPDGLDWAWLAGGGVIGLTVYAGARLIRRGWPAEVFIYVAFILAAGYYAFRSAAGALGPV
jgi:PTS system mannose-specific IID component